MIRTWAADITPLCQEDLYRECYRRVPLFRREKADRRKDIKAKAQSVGVWLLYEQMRKEYGIKEGNPYNFSHSGEYVLCSVETEAAGKSVRVGCDIEQVRSGRQTLARRFFCQAEWERIARETEGQGQDEMFCRYWVLKESFVKATGRGLALGLSSFEVVHGDPSVLVRQPEEFPEPFYYMESATENQRYRIAVCSTDRQLAPPVQKGFIL